MYLTARWANMAEEEKEMYTTFHAVLQRIQEFRKKKEYMEVAKRHEAQGQELTSGLGDLAGAALLLENGESNASQEQRQKSRRVKVKTKVKDRLKGKKGVDVSTTSSQKAKADSAASTMATQRNTAPAGVTTGNEKVSALQSLLRK